MPRGSKPGEHRGGRKKGTKNRNTIEIQAMAAKHGPAALQVHVDLLTNENVSIRLAAAEKLLDRGFGRPSQSSDINLKGDLSVIVATGVPKLANGDR